MRETSYLGLGFHVMIDVVLMALGTKCVSFISELKNEYSLIYFLNVLAPLWHGFQTCWWVSSSPGGPSAQKGDDQGGAAFSPIFPQHVPEPWSQLSY